MILWLATLRNGRWSRALVPDRPGDHPARRTADRRRRARSCYPVFAQTIDDRGEDELARLARSFNAMLRALAASRQQQAQLISDAGHELRTPLTSLRTNIEVLLRVKDLPDQDRADLFTDVHAQLEEMTTLVGDVVELAPKTKTSRNLLRSGSTPSWSGPSNEPDAELHWRSSTSS